MRDAAADRFPPFPCNAPSAGLLGINFSQVNRGNCDSKMSFAVPHLRAISYPLGRPHPCDEITVERLITVSLGKSWSLWRRRGSRCCTGNA